MMQAKLLEQTGVVEEGIQRRQAYGRFSERRVSFPPSVDEITRPFKAKISGMEAQIENLQALNRSLEHRLATLRNRLYRQKVVPDFVPTDGVTIGDVQLDLLTRLERHNYRVSGELITRDMLCSSHKRPRGYVIARHVGIWLARRICPKASLNQLGRGFCMDHTSCIYAIDRAPYWMSLTPFWAQIATEVLQAFGHTEMPDGSMQ